MRNNTFPPPSLKAEIILHVFCRRPISELQELLHYTAILNATIAHEISFDQVIKELYICGFIEKHNIVYFRLTDEGARYCLDKGWVR
jgi:predicted transcriptional regulator